MEKLKIGNMNVSFLSATRYHINGGILLMVIVLLAMIIANSPWGDAYAAFWNKEVHLQIGEFNLFSHNGNHMTLMNFINDALMTIFFFSVGLEIKRETLVGELSSFRQALLPIVAACGGMIVPVIIYYCMTSGTDAESGLAIPMATDIAFPRSRYSRSIRQQNFEYSERQYSRQKTVAFFCGKSDKRT